MAELEIVEKSYNQIDTFVDETHKTKIEIETITTGGDFDFNSNDEIKRCLEIANYNLEIIKNNLHSVSLWDFKHIKTKIDGEIVWEL